MTPAELIADKLRDNMRACAGVPMSGAEAGDAAQIAVDVIARELRAEGQRERERLHDKLHDPAIRSWVTSWEMIAHWVEGSPKLGTLAIVNHPAALPERTDHA